ncbi:MAG: HD domain-containing protein [Clostridia bacterium]|nr:HD domain-containing protein [Clostridia bacterium]
MKKTFEAFAATPENPQYSILIARKNGALYRREGDTRTPFERDYTRILHSNAYRRLKHKTQVFFDPENDHICTRIEHVMHVSSVSGTIAEALELSTDLTRAIATGHDLGHAPFGHVGERILSRLTKKHLGEDFWHERHGVYLADRIELLEDNCGIYRNLNLTYAVRDGIVAHCGEVDEGSLTPRKDFLDPALWTAAGERQPATFEACAVKLADKIAYLGRDIEDAISMGVLDKEKIAALNAIAKAHGVPAINTTVLMHDLIADIASESTPDTGILLSERTCALINTVKRFNTEHIYKHERLQPFCRYAELVLTELFDALSGYHKGKDTLFSLAEAAARGEASRLLAEFAAYLAPYVTCKMPEGLAARYPAALYQNDKVYGDLSDKADYLCAVRDYVAGMTDTFAIKMYESLLSLG